MKNGSRRKVKPKLLIILLCILAGVLIFDICAEMNRNRQTETTPTPMPSPTAKPVDYGDFTLPVKGVRPYAVMIDNQGSRVLPQGGLHKAQIIYEILAEGGETRYMAVFWGKGSPMIGPVRSARHYFLDYAMENDAIYVHFGWSPFARTDISKLGINNINGIFAAGTFWDITNERGNWQDSYTSTAKIKDYVKEHKYRQKTDKGLLFTYNIEDVVPAGGSKALNVQIAYNLGHYSSYKYNSKTRLYKRYRYGVPQMERVSKKQLTAKNIIIEKVGISNISNDAKGRQTLSDIGSGTGWYISCGKSVKIKWSKASRSAQTKYTLANGDPLVINPGQTWVQIIPLTSKPTIK